MPDLQCFHDWQEAERRAEVAQDAVTAIRRDRHSPTQAQLDELQQLRDSASVKLREMVGAMKAATQVVRTR